MATITTTKLNTLIDLTPRQEVARDKALEKLEAQTRLVVDLQARLDKAIEDQRKLIVAARHKGARLETLVTISKTSKATICRILPKAS